MGENNFMTAEDVARELGISKAYAYKIIRVLNSELEKLGYRTIGAKVSQCSFSFQQSSIICIVFLYNQWLQSEFR